MHTVKSALRQLLSHPRFALIVILTLGLGIGANTAIFSVVHSALLKSLPYPTPEKLVRVYETVPDGERNAVSGGAFKDWRDHAQSFDHLAVFAETNAKFSGGAQSESIAGLEVSQAFLATLGIQTSLGRDFAKGEDTAGRQNVAILTDSLWRRRFGADPAVLGRAIQINEVAHVVIGVLPPASLLHGEAQYLVTTAIDADPDAWQHSGHWRHVIGRLRASATTGSAEIELRAIKQRLHSSYPAFKNDWSVSVLPMREALVGDTRPMLMTLLATAAFVLLIACVNVSNLLLARGHARMSEMAVRTAIGASPAQIRWQLLTESLLLALAGCGVGLIFAVAGVHVLGGMAEEMLPSALAPRLNATVLLFSILLAGSCGLAAGLAPALRAGQADIGRDLKDSERGSSSKTMGGTRATLLIAQFAFTTLLLVGAGLFARSFVLLLNADAGFRPEHTLAFDLEFSKSKYPQTEDRMRAIEALQQRLGGIAGIEAIGATSSLPLSRTGPTEFASRGDREARSDYVVGTDFVSGNFFEALGVRLLRGRGIEPPDNVAGASRVLVINDRLAHDLYPGEDAVGRPLRLLGESWQIVGIVESVRHYVMHEPAPPRIYAAQRFWVDAASIVMRSQLPPEALAPVVRRTLRDIDADQPITNLRTLDHDMRRALATQRVLLVLVGLFALLAVTLAAVGIYGAMAHSVGQRTREFGIRAALGANRRDLLRLIMRTGMRPSIIGIALGLLVALALARLLQSMLFEVDGRDPLVFGIAGVLMATMAAWAVFIPARQVMAGSPVSALRNE